MVSRFYLRHAAALNVSALNEHGVSAALSFVSVARLGEIPTDRGLRVEIDGIAVGLYRVDETIYAMEDTCPHAGYPLSEGELSGCVISCHAHGWPFDIRTGFDPDNADGFPIPCFAVEIEGDEVRVDLADRINDPRRGRGASTSRS